MAYISSLAVLHFKSSPSPTKKFHCIWIRTFAENSATKKAAAWTGIRLRSPDTTEPNRLESNYKKTHLSFALKKAQTYFLPSFWHGNVHIWHRAYTHFAINLYYLLKCSKSFGDASIIFCIEQHSLPFLPLVTRNLFFSSVNYF